MKSKIYGGPMNGKVLDVDSETTRIECAYVPAPAELWLGHPQEPPQTIKFDVFRYGLCGKEDIDGEAYAVFMPEDYQPKIRSVPSRSPVAGIKMGVKP